MNRCRAVITGTSGAKEGVGVKEMKAKTDAVPINNGVGLSVIVWRRDANMVVQRVGVVLVVVGERENALKCCAAAACFSQV